MGCQSLAIFFFISLIAGVTLGPLYPAMKKIEILRDARLNLKFTPSFMVKSLNFWWLHAISMLKIDYTLFDGFLAVLLVNIPAWVESSNPSPVGIPSLRPASPARSRVSPRQWCGCNGQYGGAPLNHWWLHTSTLWRNVENGYLRAWCCASSGKEDVMGSMLMREFADWTS